MKTDAELRVGVIGYGSMGKLHARAIMGTPGLHLVGVYDEVNERLSSALPVAEFSHLDDLLGQHLDYCVIATPSDTHLDVAKRVADASTHALIEKPISPTSETASEISSKFEECGLKAFVGHIERFNPAISELRNRLEHGQLGDVYQISTRRQSQFPARIADVGVVLDLASHDLDTTSWLVESPYERIRGELGHRAGRDHEDLMVAVGTLANATVVNHVVNWVSPYKERLTVVTGERGTLVADTLTCDLTFWANGSIQHEWESISGFRGVSEGDCTRYAFVKREPIVQEHEAMRDALRGGETRLATASEGIRVVEVAERIVRSGTTRYSNPSLSIP